MLFIGKMSETSASADAEKAETDIQSKKDDLGQLMDTDDRVGWPNFSQDITPLAHGWFRPGNVETLTHLIQPDFKCIVELGSWLGSSTLKLLKTAPNALIFAVDIWSNEYFLNDSHYDKSDPVFSNILNGCSIYHQFLANTKGYRVKRNDAGDYQGLVPMQMKSSEALAILRDMGIKPDLIYIDASHHYDFVVEDVTLCLRYFPDAMLVGDDWDNLDVRRAVQDVARSFQLSDSIFVNGGTCWTFEKAKMENLVTKKRQRDEEEAEKLKRQKVIKQSSFGDLLKMYKK